MSYKYINPFTDFGFKKIFGEEANKDLLISFLNELLRYEDQEIKELRFKKQEQLPDTLEDRKVVYDLFCENEKGEKFIVEMQQAKQKFFKDRMLFYSTFPIKEQAPKGMIIEEGGKKVAWNYELKAVYVIAVLNFLPPVEIETEGKVISRNKLLDVETHSVFYDKLTFITLEMPYFNKTIDELENNFDKWLYVLKNLDTFDRIPEKIKDKIFEKLFSVAEYARLSPDEQLEYEKSLSAYRDLYAVIDTAKEDGRKEAEEEYKKILEKERREKEEARKREEEARKKAEQERREKEEAKKREEEVRKRLIATAKVMKENGIDIETIASATGLSKEEIEKL